MKHFIFKKYISPIGRYKHIIMHLSHKHKKKMSKLVFVFRKVKRAREK